MINRELWPILIIIPIALIIKLVYIFTGISDPAAPAALSVDALYHYRWAEAIADGDIWVNAPYFRAPFYSFILALLLKISGDSLQFVRVVQVLIGLATLFFLYRLTCNILGKVAAIIAAAIYLLYPITTYFEGELLLDPLFTLLALISLYYFWPDKKGRIKIFTAGLFFGLAAITRPAILIFTPIIIYYLWTRRDISIKSTNKIRAMALFLMSLGISILPITLVNYLNSGQLILVSYQGGINFYIGNNPEADGISASLPPYGCDWQLDDAAYLVYKESGKHLDYGQQSWFWINKSLDYIINQPSSFIGLYLKKLYYLLSGHEISNNRYLRTAVFENNILKLLPIRIPIILALGIIPLIFYRRASFIGLPSLYGIILIYAMTIGLFFINSRFRLPMVPILAILAASGINMLTQKVKNRQINWNLAITIIIALAVYLLLALKPLPEARPDQAQALFLKANKEFRAGDYWAAISDYDSLTRTIPYIKNSYLNLGNSLLKTGESDKALAAFRNELKQNETSAEALNNIGVIFQLRNNLDSAHVYFNKALSIKPYYLQAAVNLLRLAERTSQTSIKEEIEMSRMDFRHHLTSNPVYLFEEGVYFATEGRIGEAINSQNQAIDHINSRSRKIPFESDYSDQSIHQSKKILALAHYQLGYLLGLSGEYYNSITHSIKAIELDDGNKMAHINLISGYRSLGMNQKADSVAEIYLSRWPTSSDE